MITLNCQQCGVEFRTYPSRVKEGKRNFCSRACAAAGYDSHPPYAVAAGDKFGKLTAVEIAGRSKCRRVLWKCRCDCGGETVVMASNLKNGNSRTCGCSRITHGATDTPTYRSWHSMIHRCSSPYTNGYENYGGRGIKVCPEWSDFEQFLADMGERPAGKTLDRIDPDGDYEPSNCRWATPVEQAANKRPRHEPSTREEVVA